MHLHSLYYPENTEKHVLFSVKKTREACEGKQSRQKGHAETTNKQKITRLVAAAYREAASSESLSPESNDCLMRKNLLLKPASSYGTRVNENPRNGFMNYGIRRPWHIWPNHACFHGYLCACGARSILPH